jgi:hypothetical protein
LRPFFVFLFLFLTRQICRFCFVLHQQRVMRQAERDGRSRLAKEISSFFHLVASSFLPPELQFASALLFLS